MEMILTYGSGFSIRQGYVVGGTNGPLVEEIADWNAIPFMIKKIMG